MTSGQSTELLLDSAYSWAAAREFRGVDPYDALKAPIFSLIPPALRRSTGLVLTQSLKRLPVDPRPFLGIRSGWNPKAIALFLAACARAGKKTECPALATRLLELRSPKSETYCWGYNFPWQGRAFYLPAWTPTVVVTSFAGEALLLAHQVTGNPQFLAAARDACRFLLTDLWRSEDDSGACLSYSPLDRTTVYNASLLGAKLLTLVGRACSEPHLIESADPLVRYVLARQQDDGSWVYGGGANQQWIDSFHTGFVIAALDSIHRVTQDEATKRAVKRGVEFYQERFFGREGEPFYYADRHYPLDIHSAAQGILTFLQAGEGEPRFTKRAQQVGRWMVNNLLGEEGYFYYQIRRTHTVRIPYMRWSQAWGVRALAELTHHGVEL